jgi:hypothetical protein
VVSELEHLLLDIAARETSAELSDDARQQVSAVLDDTGLETDGGVPDWLSHFFGALATGQEVEPSPLPATGPDQGDVWAFFDLLQDIRAFDCYDQGEWVRVRLTQSGMLGLASVEQAYYCVTALDEIFDDDSDLARAKEMDRPTDQ